jgi:hypothetical protein
MEAMYPDFYWDGNAFVFADGIIREYKVFDLLGRNIEQVKSGNYYVLQFSDNGDVYRVKTFIYNE